MIGQTNKQTETTAINIRCWNQEIFYFFCESLPPFLNHYFSMEKSETYL